MDDNGLKTALIVSDPIHMKRAMQIASDIGITAWSSPTPSTRYESLGAKLAFLIQETWHMIGYFLYPKGLSETPRSGNTSAIAPHRNTAFFPICRYNSC